MSSVEPLPPAVPPVQKPTRIIKPRPPTRPRPCSFPRLAPGMPSQEAPAPRVDLVPGGQQHQLRSLPRPSNVRTIVGRFDHWADGGAPMENGAQCPPSAPPGTELREPLGPGRDACPPHCPCGCHQHQPGMVLVWMPAPQGAEQTSDSSASSEEEGPPFRRLLVVTPAPQAGRPPRQSFTPPSEGGVVLTSYRSTAQLNGGLALAKPPRRAKGGTQEEQGPPPPAVPPKVPVKPPRGSRGGLQMERGDICSRSSSPSQPLQGPPIPCKPCPRSSSSSQDPPIPGKLCPPTPSLAQHPQGPPIPGKSSSSLQPPQDPAIPGKLCPPSPSLAQCPQGPPVPGKLCPRSLSPWQSPEIPGKPCTSLLPSAQPSPPPSTLSSQDTPPPPPPSQPPPPLPPSSQSPPPLQKESTHEQGDRPCQGDGDGSSPDLELSRNRCCPSPKGPGWGLPLQDEPLYQTYRQAAISKEIQRQALPDNHPAPPETTAPCSTLWQELPAVRESGVLEHITPQECKMQESLFEVLTSEASYQRSLRLLAEHFVTSRELGETLVLRERQALFSSVLRIKEVSARFLAALEQRVAEDLLIRDVSDVVATHARCHFTAYVDYVRNQPYQEQAFSALMETNSSFAAVLAQLQAHPRCQRLPLLSFLLLPFQRITRIKMLLENILRQAEEGSERERNSLDALACVSKIVEECDSEVGRMRCTEELVRIAGRIDFDRLKAVPIVSKGRRLEKQGELAEVVLRGSLFSTKPRTVPIYLFLFSDLLLITQRKSAERFVALDYGHRSLVSVQGVSDPPPAPGLADAFYLTLLENHQGRTSERLCRAPTQSEMHRWMEAFPQPGAPPSLSQDTIYEDWDCPQVQCVEPYLARQADELSLEPADIVNVLRKTSEGWCQGLRLADGHKGWFPAGHVREITNEHVRRRNLHERHRLLQAARQLQLSRTGATA